MTKALSTDNKSRETFQARIDLKMCHRQAPHKIAMKKPRTYRFPPNAAARDDVTFIRYFVPFSSNSIQLFLYVLGILCLIDPTNDFGML